MIKTMHIYFISLILLAGVLTGLPSYAFASEAEENVLKIQKAYENIVDMKGSFVQKNIIKDLSKAFIYTGNFYIKKPLKMKWEYKGKTSQDITINDDTVLIYKKGDKQAFKGKFDRTTYGQTPIALLSGFGDIKSEFNISGKGKTLILTPKIPLGLISSINITMSGEDFPISSFTVQDGNSNNIEIELRDIKINTGIKDSIFEFSLPKGVNIFE